MLVKTEICFQFLKPRHGVHPRASSTIRRGGNHWRPGRTVIAKPSSTSIMAERLEDLSLPNTVVTRLAKETLPDGVNVAKEARTAIDFRKLQKEKKDAVAKRKLQKKQDDPAMEEEIDKESMELTEDE
ncbi:uncharacterized protein [Anabrus simplex]|uniref:uncharacterized protein isoform X4 n=1 Tax=Anabrus simplex TaxID=316456 RepID=UPI0035A2F8E2